MSVPSVVLRCGVGVSVPWRGVVLKGYAQRAQMHARFAEIYCDVGRLVTGNPGRAK
ncbi:hypothetical protein [Gordonia insulae]|uniref:hypothetical protein n=1 Tax=Gordonia insulae TaxID=2420509 RepID=UPI0013DDDF26|nr:hypothetical protein [Gordonia insulae]